jgi:hypothetical protein
MLSGMEDIMLELIAPATTAPGQFVREGVGPARWSADRERFLALLEAEGLDVGLYDSAFNPYPFLVAADRLAELRALQGSIYRAIVAVVTHFPKDGRLSRTIRLPQAEQDLLSVLAGKPYRPGSFRPDYLHAADGREMVAEINARFTLNGYISSVLLNRCAPRLHPELSPLPALEHLEPALRRRLGEGPVGILKASEGGCDIHLLRKRWGRDCDLLDPKELTAGHLARWGGVVLELHQQELLGAVPAEVQAWLAMHAGVLNDLRTILIAHDKRLLALLSTDRVLEDYLEPDDVMRLRRHVVPTWVKGMAPEKVREARACPEGWLAKPPRSGKGKGIVVSSTMSPAGWRKALDEMPDDWVLQPYVPQRLFPIAVLREGDVVRVPMRVVGLLPSLDDRAFGPGLFRAAPDEIVNVARGGTILAPALPGVGPCLD